ncbi:MAG: hypothetical protein HYS17_10840 [Micavibrio aeruginosavorus]|uniref:Uncharacterized protein n=1 Tax=Micavibrio aeruginosavorus TaxID=349221 RepID=A0A7T5UH29_9BACT|nr:MAG: hypothetical protein HYS17_10840 [Micavibrio aeruginosavorus]
MPLPLALAAAWPVVSASLMTAGRYVAMTAVPAIARFATAPSTVSALSTSFNVAANVVKGVWNNKLLAGTAMLTADGLLGTNMTSTAVKGVASAVSGVAGVTMDGVKNNAKDIDQTLTGGKVTAAVGGAAGAPSSNPNAPADQRSQSQEGKMQQMLSGMMEKAKNDPFMALGIAIGGIAGMKGSDGMMEAAWKVPLYATMYGFMFKMLGPIIAPLLGAGASMLKDGFHSAQVKPYANGAVPSTAEPRKTAPAVDAANDGSKPAASAPAVSAFRDNGLMMTAQADVRKAGINPAIPAANRDQYALTMNG